MTLRARHCSPRVEDTYLTLRRLLWVSIVVPCRRLVIGGRLEQPSLARMLKISGSALVQVAQVCTPTQGSYPRRWR